MTLQDFNADRAAIRAWLEEAMQREPGSDGLRELYEILGTTDVGDALETK